MVPSRDVVVKNVSLQGCWDRFRSWSNLDPCSFLRMKFQAKMCVAFRRSGLIDQQPVRWPDPFNFILYSYRDQVVALREFGHWSLPAEALNLLDHIPVSSGPEDSFQLPQFLSGFSPVIAGFLQEG